MEEVKRKKSVHKKKSKHPTENLDANAMKVEVETGVKSQIFSKELNQHLLDEISILTAENDNLKKQIGGNNLQMEKQSKLVSTLKDEIRNIIAAGGHSISTKSSGIISSKITALCKQNRHLVSELELHKTKCGQLERRLVGKELMSQQSMGENEEMSLVKEQQSLLELSELRYVKEKLAQTTRKFVDVKNKNTDLKNELLVANKCLHTEIGPSFVSIQKLSSDAVGFKGRSQEILVLKAKVSELEEKLFGKNKNVDQNKENYNQLIKDIETRRKTQIDKTTRGLEVLQMEHNDLKLKYDGVVARNKILTCEIVQHKQSVQGLHEKSIYDEKIKDELLNKMKDIEARYQGKLAENERILDETKTKIDAVNKELESEKYRVKALVNRLGEKDEKIKYLNEKLDKVVDNSLQKVYYTPLQVTANNEIKTLTDLLNKTNKRLEDERKKTTDVEKLYFGARQAKLMMQRKHARMTLELKELKTRKIKSESSIHHSCNLSAASSMSTIIHCSDKECVHFEMERTLNKLELAQEQIKFLEDRMKILEDEKSADFESIDEMIFNSKKVFTEALKNCKELNE